MSDPRPSWLLGDAQLAGLDDVAAARMLDPAGVYLGSLEDQGPFFNGGAHLLTYARTGAGKGRDVILPNLAHVRNQSLVVVDVKDGENAYASALRRPHTLGQRIVFLNPWNLFGAGNTRVNPLARLVRLAAQGVRVEVAARKISHSSCRRRRSWRAAELRIWKVAG